MEESKEMLKLMGELSKLELNQTEFQIVTALRWYGSLNLKKISKLIQRPESTTLRFIRKLRDRKIIIFDSEISEKNWGNFYKLSEKVKKLYESYMKMMYERVDRIQIDLKEIDNLSDEELHQYSLNEVINPGKLAEIPSTRAYFQFVANLQNLIVNETMDGIEHLAELAEEEGYESLRNRVILPPLDVSAYVSAVKISKIRHVLRISDLIIRFDKEIDALAKEIIKEMDAEGVPEEERTIQFVNVFTGGLDAELKFKDIER